jgi:hypothetical protein
MSSSIDRFYSQEYVMFIRSKLISSCYLTFCKEVYNCTNNTNCIYAYETLNFKNDKQIWDRVFQKENSLFLYYLHLSTDYLSVLPRQRHILYLPCQTSNTYEQVTFQEYVDKRLNLQSIGYREYQKFIKSMNDYNFKKKLIEKYRIENEIINLKNYVIYVIQLLLSKETNSSEHFTEEELMDMNISTQPIHFFEYLCRSYKKSTSDTLSVNSETFIALEDSVIKQLLDN